MDNQISNRDGFQSKWGFILACIGSAVGMGNIWRFPILVSQYGGMTFLIPYFIFVVLIGSTGVVTEMALGRSSGSGPVGAFGKATKFKFGNEKIGKIFGLIPVIGSLAMAMGYTCVMAWVFKYTFMSISGSLTKLGQDVSIINEMFSVTASAGGANLWIVVAIGVSFLIMTMGISNGIEKVNKIMMPVLFILFFGLAIYIYTLPGASKGYEYIFTIDPKGITNPKVWIYAFGQAFFSLSVAGSGTVIYGSYLSKKESIPSSAKNVTIFCTISALMAAFVIIPAMASANAPLDAGGPGLMFIHIVHVINGMAAGRIVGIVFFVSVLFAGISSIINLYETSVACLQEVFGLKRSMATAIIHILGCIVAILIQSIVSSWMDFISIYLCPLGAVLAAVMFLWLFTKEHVYDAVNEGSEKPIGNWYYPLSKYVYVIAATIVLIAGAIMGGIG